VAVKFDLRDRVQEGFQGERGGGHGAIVKRPASRSLASGTPAG
jgi:hypothetical protein